ncbi:MAG: hypothetical protein JRI43_03490 [Deltaproteobacteria bacterium]|nr:hypothetical protein [Deltaproteobacteria bacterium]
MNSLKEEYLITLKNGLRSLKDSYAKGFEKETATFREEYLKITDKISFLKTEYLKAVDNANFLKDELIELFEQYSLFNRLHTE